MDRGAVDALRALIAEKDKQWSSVRSALVLDCSEDRRELFGWPVLKTGGGHLLVTPSMTRNPGAIVCGPRVHRLEGCTARLWLYAPSNLATGGPQRDYSQAVSDLDEVAERLLPLLTAAAQRIPDDWPIPIDKLGAGGGAVVVAAHALDRPPESPWWRVDDPTSLGPVSRPDTSGVFVRYPSCGAFAMLRRLVDLELDAVTPDAPAVKLPSLKPWAMEAWKANLVGMTKTAIASTLAKKYNDPRITQPRVSEQIQRAELHAEASGLTVDAARALPQVGSRAPARTLDPAAAELGKRTDGKAHHLRERERQKAEDGDDKE